jgi:hypothetical protein
MIQLGGPISNESKNIVKMSKNVIQGFHSIDEISNLVKMNEFKN